GSIFQARKVFLQFHHTALNHQGRKQHNRHQPHHDHHHAHDAGDPLFKSQVNGNDDVAKKHSQQQGSKNRRKFFEQVPSRGGAHQTERDREQGGGVLAPSPQWFCLLAPRQFFRFGFQGRFPLFEPETFERDLTWLYF